MKKTLAIAIVAVALAACQGKPELVTLTVDKMCSVPLTDNRCPADKVVPKPPVATAVEMFVVQKVLGAASAPK